ncbi:MAG: ABC transporter permease [Alphaproteobacteria bacterium]|nr:ABC transporter permease [Alphaproteobacteria bacterium]
MTLSYLVRRLGSIVVTMLLVSFVVFAITQILPGNAATMILGEFATAEAIENLSRQLGLDAPWYVQYLRWLGGVMSGDWGMSMTLSRPVLPEVLAALGRSGVLAGLSLAVVTAIAVPLGVWAAVRQGRPADMAIGGFSYLGISLPEFVTATLLLVFLVRPEIGIFPAGGYQPLAAGLGTFLIHLALPVTALAIVLTAHIVRQTRSEMVDVLQAEFVRTATLKGLPRRTVLFKHALRNALLPTVTVLALDVGYLIGGVLVVEDIFAYPGLGRLLMFAMQNRDLPMLQAGTLVMAAVYAMTNLASDLVYGVLDRRIQHA